MRIIQLTGLIIIVGFVVDLVSTIAAPVLVDTSVVFPQGQSSI